MPGVSDAPRVLALVPDAYGWRGGIAQYNRDFLEALIESKAASSVMAVALHAPASWMVANGIQQWKPRGGKAGYAFAAVCLALRHRYNVVFCGHIHFAPLAALTARIAKAKLILQAHGYEAWQERSPIQRAAVDAADVILCVSRYTRSALLKWSLIAPERVVVIPNTVGERFCPGSGRELRQVAGWDGRKVLLTVGRLSSAERYKGQDRVIGAIPALLARGHDIQYVIVGAGDDRERLSRIAADAGVGDRVQFIGECDAEKLPDFYRASDLFVMPSTGEGFGISFLEAMACGTPALGLAKGGARDALADGELGNAVDEARLVDEIDRMLSEPLGTPPLLADRVRARFGREVFASNLRTVFSRLVESPQRTERVSRACPAVN